MLIWPRLVTVISDAEGKSFYHYQESFSASFSVKCLDLLVSCAHQKYHPAPFFLLYLQSKSCFKPQPGNQTQCCSSSLPPTAHLTTVAKGGCRHQHPRAPRLCRLNPTLLCSQLSILALSLIKCFQTFLTCTCHCTEVKISFMKKGRKPLDWRQTCMLTPDTWWCGESVQLNVILPSFYWKINSLWRPH